MKTLHYVLIAKHLPSDSKVSFFPTRELADIFFNSYVEPLLKICLDNELEEDEVYSFGQTKNIIRFDSGYDEDLDSVLGECNHYFHVNSIEVADDVDYYVADFSEWVDESLIDFFNKEEAVIKYNELVDAGIEMQNDTYSPDEAVNRHDQSTWGDDLFLETDNGDDGTTDAFFGFSDVFWTNRIGKIHLTK